MFGVPIRALAVIGVAVILLVLGSWLFGRWQGWDARGRLAAAERSAEIAELQAETERLRAQLTKTASEAAERTAARTGAITEAERRGREEIASAAASLDAHMLYAAWADARLGVYADAGLAPTAPGGDPDPGGIAPGVRSNSDAA